MRQILKEVEEHLIIDNVLFYYSIWIPLAISAMIHILPALLLQ